MQEDTSIGVKLNDRSKEGGSGSLQPISTVSSQASRTSVIGNGIRRFSGVGASSRTAPSAEATKKSDGSASTSWTIRFLDVIATTSLFMLFFGFPLFFLSSTLQGIGFEKQLYFYFWLLVGIVGWVSKGIVSGELRIRRTPLDIPVLILWLVVGVSSFFSVDKWHSVWGAFGDPSKGFIGITALVLAYFFIVNHGTIERFRLILAGILLSGTLVSFWTIITFAGIRFFPATLSGYVMPLSLMGSMRSLTLFFGMLLPLFILGFFIVTRDFQKKVVAFWSSMSILGIGVLFTLYALFAVYGFTPWIAILAGVGFLLLYVLAQVIHFGDRLNWFPMVLFVVILIFYMLGNQGMKLVSNKIAILPEVALNTASSWEVAQNALKERLIVGSGPATYGYNFSLYKPETLNVGMQSNFRFYQGGNLFLELLPTIGVVGAFFFIILALAFLGVGLNGLSREKSRNKPLSLALWSSAVIFFVSMFHRPIDGTILIYGVLICSMAVLVLLEESGAHSNIIALSLKASPRFALALAFTFMVVSAGVAFLFTFLGKTFIADASAGKASRELSIQGINNDSIVSMRRATDLTPYEGRYHALLGQMYMLLVNQEVAKPEADRDTEKVKSIVEANVVPRLNEAMKRMPNDVYVHEVAGQAYENISLLAGSDPTVLAKTAEIYKRSMELDPMNPNFPVKLGLINRVLANRDDQKSKRTDLLEESKSYFQSAIDKKADFGDAYLNMALTEEAIGNIGAATENLEKAMSLSSSQDIRFHLARILQNRGTEDDLNRAERISLDALKKDEKNVNILLNLGFVYEKKKENASAIKTYERLYTIFEGENFAEIRKQVGTLIENVSNGKGNTNGNTSIPDVAPAESTEIPSAVENVSNESPILPPPSITPTPTPAEGN